MAGLRGRAAVAATNKFAPQVAGGFVRQVLDRAIDGVGPLPSARKAADAHLVDTDGDVEAAITRLVRRHTALAGAQGFVTNLGGIAAVAVAVPANVVGVTLVQAHMVAGVAALRGYDLTDPRVRNAILVCMLGEDAVKDLLKSGKLPSPPMTLATSPVHSPELDRIISHEVTAELVTRTVGRRAVTLVARRVPLIGGAVAGGSDGWSTRQIGQYAARELKDRNIPKRQA
ncbi:uncharacterized protein (DUF697 family) [Aeromicrobium sp. SORGH_AS981]|uniref:EcsC family protein n=1 Tax=Aeromicrobium sp. SORGH_AS_0981 TaxID=3041802 RepID=UPI00285EF4E5|nr:EcsC family protein [Aeromicrobium sp. SORGH_AS_0981]MDR6117639.1 uncharacterized protein (DUF697 family) [Aeromicrobium sp. SORGH_AS_0981]